MREPPSHGLGRREALRRIAAAGAVFGGAAAASRFFWDPGGFDLSTPSGERQVRSFGTPPKAGERPVLAVAKSSTDPAVLARKAVDALGGMKAFVSNGDV